jgi:hypothetical protein
LRSIEWCAGFFEGEGSTYVRKHKKGTKMYPSFVLSLTQVYREPLDAFCELLGGKVRGPYGPYTGNRQPHFQWNISGQAAIPIAELLIPLMFRKGIQVKEALAEYKESLNV